MKPPAGNRLKTADVAEKTGLSEEQISDIARRHGNRIPSQKVGRIQVYDEKAVDMFAAIAEKEGKGKAEYQLIDEERSKSVEKQKEKNSGSSRLSSISKVRDDEEKTAKATQKKTFTGGVPNHLVKTVAMQGQQFSRFADRMTKLEDAVAADREGFGERIDRLERQVAALQEQMEAVDSWIAHVDQRLDSGDARVTHLAEDTHTWTEYVRGELAYLRLSWWERRQQK